MRKPYTLYRRTRLKGKPIYYVQFYDEDGRRLPGRSSGQSTKGAAEVWAIGQIKQGVIGKKTEIRFSVYAKNWYVWDTCEYLSRERSRRDYQQQYADQQRAHVVNHLIPAFGNSKLAKITTEEIEGWLLDTRRRISAATANRALSALRIMLSEAVRLGYLSKSPADFVKKLQEKPKQKGIFTNEERLELLDPKNFDLVWDSDLLHYAMNLLAAFTGMRKGELQALLVCNLNLEYVKIEHSWDKKYKRLVPPKAGSRRIIPIPAYVYRIVYDLIEIQGARQPDSLIFTGKLPDKAIDQRAIDRHYNNALAKIGITEAQRKDRNLTFHSWRHLFNSFLRGKVTDADLQRVTGHKTDQMTLHYDHQMKEALAGVRKVIDTLVPKKLLGTDGESTSLLDIKT